LNEYVVERLAILIRSDLLLGFSACDRPLRKLCWNPFIVCFFHQPVSILVLLFDAGDSYLP
jgi:hypothetical protein